MKRILWMACFGVFAASFLSAQESKAAGNKTKGPPKEIAVDLGGGVNLKMTLIPAGEFKMDAELQPIMDQYNEAQSAKIRLSLFPHHN